MVANCWDSYGEALRMHGNNAGAIISYTKALELKPDMETSQTGPERTKN